MKNAFALYVFIMLLGLTACESSPIDITSIKENEQEISNREPLIQANLIEPLECCKKKASPPDVLGERRLIEGYPTHIHLGDKRRMKIYLDWDTHSYYNLNKDGLKYTFTNTGGGTYSFTSTERNPTFCIPTCYRFVLSIKDIAGPSSSKVYVFDVDCCGN